VWAKAEISLRRSTNVAKSLTPPDQPVLTRECAAGATDSRERNRPNGTWGRPLSTREGADDSSNRKSWLILLTFYVVGRLGGPIHFPKAAECSASCMRIAACMALGLVLGLALGDVARGHLVDSHLKRA